MRKNINFWLSVFLLLAAGSAALASTITVMVQETQIRKRPQFYAPAVATARLGDRFEADAASGGWYGVTAGGGAGFIHESAVTAKKIKLSSAKSIGAGGTSAEEVTLAGKGFNEQVESSYKGQHPNMNFAAVDAMERRKVADGEVVRFMKTGKLLSSDQGGGR